MLITGTTGSGKTNLMHILNPQIRAKNQQAIVLDNTGEMIQRYYNPQRGDIIFNPFDDRGHAWNFWKEVENESFLNIVADALFGQDKNADQFWSKTSKIVFADAVREFSSEKSIKKLHLFLTQESLKTVSNTLKNTSSRALLNPESERTAANIHMNIVASFDWMKCLNENTEKQFSLQDWVSTGGESWLFLSANPQERATLTPIISTLFDVAINSIMAMLPSSDRRIWLIIDELASLGKLPSLSMALSEIRKYGGCMIVGMQSISQLFDKYGYYEGTALFGQFNTKFFFRNTEENIAKILSNLAGKAEIDVKKENVHYSASEHRDSVSIHSQKEIRELIKSADIASLNDLECYVHLPIPQMRFAKIQMKYA
jgi:type IV conjugative transfer system coupling protein TraD